MKTYSQVDLATKALGKLGVTIVGQDPDPENMEKVLGEIPGLFEQLSASLVIYVNDPDRIEGKFMDPLCILLANRCATDFGAGFDQGAQDREETKLRWMQPRPSVYDAQRVDYF